MTMGERLELHASLEKLENVKKTLAERNALSGILLYRLNHIECEINALIYDDMNSMISNQFIDNQKRGRENE